jgi:hypothetical protein
VGTIWDSVAGCSEHDTRPASCLKCEGICLQIDLLLTVMACHGELSVLQLHYTYLIPKKLIFLYMTPTYNHTLRAILYERSKRRVSNAAF